MAAYCEATVPPRLLWLDPVGFLMLLDGVQLSQLTLSRSLLHNLQAEAVRRGRTWPLL